MSGIPILMEKTKPSKGATLSRTSDKAKTEVTVFPTEKLQQSLSALTDEFATIMQDIKEVGDFNLSTVQIQVGIDAEVGFVLIGKAGVKGTVTLTFSNE